MSLKFRPKSAAGVGYMVALVIYLKRLSGRQITVLLFNLDRINRKRLWIFTKRRTPFMMNGVKLQL